jgi:hypothetical protein
MLNPPTTKEEAERKRYGVWAGNPKGRTYDPNCCAYEKHEARGTFHQCHFKPGKGPGGLYCGTHARVLARRQP